METKPTILVAVDFAPASDDAFVTALSLAKRHQTSLTLVHVAVASAFIPASVAMLIELDHVKEAKRLLEVYIDRAVAEGVTATTLIDSDDVVRGILRAIDKVAPEMVVVGSHGHSGFTRALLGSTSEALTRRSPVPVLVVPSHDRRAVAAAEAWACHACGHIVARGETTSFCAQCGVEGGRWDVAPMSGGGTSDVAQVEGDRETLPNDRVQGSLGFTTAPPGGGNYVVNPELKIRY
jgi:nucleotide-binding universal stress UspA family protein